MSRAFLGGWCGWLCTLWACGSGPTIVVEPLQVVSWVPNRGAQCVAADRADFAASVQFSDDIETSTLAPETLYVRPEAGAPLDATLVYTKETQTAAVTVAADLDYGAVYELVVTDEIRGVKRGRLAASLVSSFRTLSAGGCF